MNYLFTIQSFMYSFVTFAIIHYQRILIMTKLMVYYFIFFIIIIARCRMLENNVLITIWQRSRCDIAINNIFLIPRHFFPFSNWSPQTQVTVELFKCCRHCINKANDFCHLVPILHQYGKPIMKAINFNVEIKVILLLNKS